MSMTGSLIKSPGTRGNKEKLKEESAGCCEEMVFLVFPESSQFLSGMMASEQLEGVDTLTVALVQTPATIGPSQMIEAMIDGLGGGQEQPNTTLAVSSHSTMISKTGASRVIEMVSKQATLWPQTSFS